MVDILPLFQNKHQPQMTPDVEAILLEGVETAIKRKNARRLFARSLKGLEKEKVNLPEIAYILYL